jgi:hypothetical protein
MSGTKATPADPAVARRAWRGFAITMAIAALIAALGFLVIGEFFEQYHGMAVAHRPVQGSDGVDDPVRRFVIERADGSWFDQVLPVAAFGDAELPFSPTGAPPRTMPEDAVEVHKDPFTLEVQIDGLAWPTSGPIDLIFPLAFLALAAIGRNLFTTGDAFKVVPDENAHVPIPIQDPHGQVAPTQGDAAASRPRSKKGPPPQRHRRGRGRRK